MNAATDVTVTPTTISARTPAGTAGPVDVVVTNPDGGSVTRTAGFQYVATPTAPTITGVTPASGPTTGGNTVVVTGTSFNGATQTNERQQSQSPAIIFLRGNPAIGFEFTKAPSISM